MGYLKGLKEETYFPFPEGMRGFSYKHTSITYTEIDLTGYMKGRENEEVRVRHLTLGSSLRARDLVKVLAHFGYDLAKPIEIESHRRPDGTTYTYIQEILPAE